MTDPPTNIETETGAAEDRPPATSAEDQPPAATPDASWEETRDLVLRLLDEDPVNERVLSFLLQRRETEGCTPAQRVLAALSGRIPSNGSARRLLQAAMDLQERRGRHEGVPVPLRAALFEVMLNENLGRTNPFRVELRVSPAPALEGVADAAQGPTSRDAIVGELQADIRRAVRFSHEVTVLMLRLDGWDDLVWGAGQAIGERLIQEIALEVKNEIRDVDWMARTPEQSLVVVLNGTGRFGAMVAAQRIRSKLKNLTLPLSERTWSTSMSVGIGVYPRDARFGRSLLEAAENALYRARAEGLGGVATDGTPPPRRLLQIPAEKVRVAVRTVPESNGGGSPQSTTEGVLFPSPVPYDVGSMVELDCIEVEGTGRVHLQGRVIRLEQRPDGGFDIGISCVLNGAGDFLLEQRGEIG